jgi:hypothetical protein
MTYCAYHCRVCGGHFRSLEAFDAHKPRNRREGGCEWPEDAPLVEYWGTCRIADDKDRHGVTIYGAERARRAQRYFGGKNRPQTAEAKPREALLTGVAA